ncbi:MAG: single-stranded-DNA-specific exonuclease RecJ [Patescibacteria group bacterium]|nr:single-stranded-DNA-specific exonuclease RecJ [Patescibacteria group bacterium]
MKESSWLIAKPMPQSYKDSFPEIHPVILQLLYNRGLSTQEAIDEFTNPDYGQDIHDPFLFRDMEKTVERIFKALKEKEPIVVHGDYDADGVCGAAIMVSALKIIEPDCQVEVYLPDRQIEGYGLNIQTVKELAKNGTKLIITVDCGTSNIEEVALANQLGLEVIITDHHMPHPELPRAFSIINPWCVGDNYPFQKLSGAGVAFKLAQALFKKRQMKESMEKWLLDLVALGTIGDYVSLVGENRTLAKYGMIVLQKTRRVGLQSLYAVMSLKSEAIDSRAVAFQIVPRLNAAGRVDHANSAYELIITGLKEEADRLALNLHKMNQERQRLTEKITQEAKTQLGEVTPEQYLLVAQGRDWPAGLVGLVASRLTDEYHRPTVIIGKRQNQIIGSGRSLPEFHITEALKKLEHLLSHYGGHRQACGFTLKEGATVSEFKKGLQELAASQLKQVDLKPKLELEAELTFGQIDWTLTEALETFAPFGEGNPIPRFVTRSAEVIDWEQVGADQKHLRLVVRDKSQVARRLIGFGFGEWGDKLTRQDKVDVAYEIGFNEWNGTRELQLKMIDIKPSHG